MKKFRAAITTSIANGLKLYSVGGGVSVPTVEAASRRLESAEEELNVSVESNDGRMMVAPVVRQLRQLQQLVRSSLTASVSSSSVRVAYAVTYPWVASGPSKDQLSASTRTSLNATIATGAVTASLHSYGFANARADRVSFSDSPGSGSGSGFSPTAAPTVISPGKISAAVILGVLGCCCFGLVGYYFAFMGRDNEGGECAQSYGQAPTQSADFTNVAPGTAGNDASATI